VPVTSLLEFLVRVGLVYTLPPATVLVVSPIILGGLLIATIGWTFCVHPPHARTRSATASFGLMLIAA